jgi:hypothetical protein
MLNFRLVRGPLNRIANEAILLEYNRLTKARIPIEEFEHWVQRSPAGPAWHALLETDEGRIVGHTCLFPFRVSSTDEKLVPAKSEFSIVHEDFRKIKIRGFENVNRPTFIIILDQLFKHCTNMGWGPIFASTNEKNQVFTRRVGLRPLQFPLWECLLTLRPGRASAELPNINSRQRAAVFATGVGQRVGWSIANLVLPRAKTIRAVPVSAEPISPEGTQLSLFEDRCSLKWRYLEGQYVRFAFDSKSSNYVIAKCGSADRYVRVCQWRLETAKMASDLVPDLVRLAFQEKALGVRWAIYETDPISSQLLASMKKAGFVCASRTRIMMVHEGMPRFNSPAVWNMNDSFFSFDP